MRFKIYQNEKSLEWHWNLVASNRRIVAVSSHGWKERRQAVESAHQVALNAWDAYFLIRDVI